MRCRHVARSANHPVCVHLTRTSPASGLCDIRMRLCWLSRGEGTGKTPFLRVMSDVPARPSKRRGNFAERRVLDEERSFSVFLGNSTDRDRVIVKVYLCCTSAIKLFFLDLLRLNRIARSMLRSYQRLFSAVYCRYYRN